MPDLDERFRLLSRTPAPDVWSDIASRGPRRLPNGPRGAHRAVVATLALVIAAAAVAFSVRTFTVDDVAPRPASTVRNGLLAFSGGGQIHVVSPDGSGLRQLTNLGHDALDVHWSPDGSKLAFRVWTNGNYQLYVANADGTDPRNLTGSMGVVHFDWSPDGTMLALTTSQRGTDYDLFVVNADGTGLHPVVESPLGEYGPRWSPDGTQIAFERWPLRDSDPGTPDIYILDLVSGRTAPVVTSSGWDTGVVWSPDGSRIAFSSEREGDEEIRIVSADGSGERKLTELPGVAATKATWSPDGERISFIAHDGEQWDVWVVNDNGTGLLKLTPSERDDGPAVWSPDGRLLAFTSSEVMEGDNTGTYDVYTIRPDGTDERRITSGSFAMGWDLSWQPVFEADPTATASPTPTETPMETTPLNPRVTATISVGAFPRAVAVGEGAVWATVDNANGGPDDHLLVEIDPATNQIVRSIPLPQAGDVSLGEGALWVTSWDGSESVLLRVDPSTTEIVASIPLGGNADDLAVGFGAIWVTVTTDENPPTGGVLRVDPVSNEVVARIPVSTGWPRDVVIGEGSVWAYGHSKLEEHGWVASSLWRIDPTSNEIVATVLDQNGFLGDGGFLPDNVAVGEGWVWAADDRGNGVRIDPVAGESTTFRLVDDRGTPNGFAWPFLAYQGHVFFGLGTIKVLDTEMFEVVESIPLKSQVADSALDPEMGTLWIANYEDTVTRIDL